MAKFLAHYSPFLYLSSNFPQPFLRRSIDFNDRTTANTGRSILHLKFHKPQCIQIRVEVQHDPFLEQNIASDFFICPYLPFYSPQIKTFLE